MKMNMKCKKCLLVLALALAYQLPTWADGRALQIWQTDGQQSDDYQFKCESTTKADFTYDGNPDENKTWYLVALFAEKENRIFNMSMVGGLVAVDDAYDFSILDTEGYILAEGVKKALFKSADEIDPTNIKPAEQARNLLARSANGKLTLIGVSGVVNVYDISGQRLLTTTANGGETIVNISHIPAGIYVVKCDKFTFKFTKK